MAKATKKTVVGWFFDKQGNVKFTTYTPTPTQTGKLHDSVGFKMGKKG